MNCTDNAEESKTYTQRMGDSDSGKTDKPAEKPSFVKGWWGWGELEK